MIYLNQRLLTQAHSGAIAPWPHSSAVAALVLALALGWLLVRPLMTGFPAASPEASQRLAEQARLQGLVDALREEGAILDLAACQGGQDLCVRVTPLFHRLDHGDQRGVGQGLLRYAEIRPAEPLAATRVRFLDATTGQELGRYAHGRLEWAGHP